MNIDKLPNASGIYAIVNRTNNHRYVGQAVNIRSRVAEHLRDLRIGKEATNKERLLQCAFDEYGEENFEAVVLCLVRNNKGEVPYRERPDNLSLAEHFYINERAEYNADRAIVRAKFQHLVASEVWCNAPDAIPELEAPPTAPRGSKTVSNDYTYMVAERLTRRNPVLVTARGERDAKAKAQARDSWLRECGTNISCWRLSQSAVPDALANGAKDYR